MKINSPAEDKIIVDLSKQDMLDLEITYEDMDYSTIETRRVIWTVLDEAGKALGKEFDPSRRMIIEAMPKNGGGCVLSFTILDARKKYFPKQQLLKKPSEKIMCEFENADALFRAAETVNTADCEISSSLYENGGKYRLIISAAEDISKIRRCFSEFGFCESYGLLECEFTKEHWREIIGENALGRILKA